MNKNKLLTKCSITAFIVIILLAVYKYGTTQTFIFALILSIISVYLTKLLLENREYKKMCSQLTSVFEQSKDDNSSAENIVTLPKNNTELNLFITDLLTLLNKKNQNACCLMMFLLSSQT